jgi:hypothetical protein
MTRLKREKIQALSLAKECYSMKLELLTNATVVDDAIRFVSSKQKVQEEEKAKTIDFVIEDQDKNNHDDNHHNCIESSEDEEEENQWPEQHKQYAEGSPTTNHTF